MSEIGACNAVIQKIQTTVDGGIRVTLDLDASNAKLSSELLNRKLRGMEQVCVAFVEIENGSDW